MALSTNEQTSAGEDVENLDPWALLTGLWNGAAAKEDSMAGFQNVKQNYHVIQQFHF